jgi:hypothetical protein
MLNLDPHSPCVKSRLHTIRLAHVRCSRNGSAKRVSRQCQDLSITKSAADLFGTRRGFMNQYRLKNLLVSSNSRNFARDRCETDGKRNPPILLVGRSSCVSPGSLIPRSLIIWMVRLPSGGIGPGLNESYGDSTTAFSGFVVRHYNSRTT